jgi:ribosomal protein S18 acetylase RimI-like enzyme
MTRSAHPLAAILDAAADGRFPPVDGRCEVLPPDVGGLRAVVAFTGHTYVLADVEVAELAARGADGYGGASKPPVVQLLAGTGGQVGSLDVVLVTAGSPGPSLPRRADLDDHPRVHRAAGYRTDLAVYGDDVGLVVLGRGVAGRREISVELLDPGASGQGHGRRLIRAGLARLRPGERCWAQVAPGNAASLRAFLACGFVPVCSEVLITPPRRP